jgi:hypothetical protein
VASQQHESWLVIVNMVIKIRRESLEYWTAMLSCERLKIPNKPVGKWRGWILFALLCRMVYHPLIWGQRSCSEDRAKTKFNFNEMAKVPIDHIGRSAARSLTKLADSSHRNSYYKRFVFVLHSCTCPGFWFRPSCWNFSQFIQIVLRIIGRSRYLHWIKLSLL